jgi:ABC-type sugar transport system permease subunit
MIRKILSIIIGYIIFVATALAFFKLTGRDAHADPSYKFMMATAVYGAVSSFIAGLVAQWIANTKNLGINYILALIIAGFATFSYFKSDGNHYTQILAIFVFAPASILGGFLLIKRQTI